MNALVESQLTELRNAIHDMEASVAEKVAAIERIEAERDALQQDQWRLKKTLSTLERDALQIKALKTENAQLKDTLASLRAQLKGVLKDIKVLREGAPA